MPETPPTRPPQDPDEVPAGPPRDDEHPSIEEQANERLERETEDDERPGR